MLSPLEQLSDSLLAEWQPHWSIKQLVEHHMAIKESLMVQDVYKLLYQANFGVEHLLADTAGVRSFLQTEMDQLEGIANNEPLIERISTSNEIVRVNLRPYRELNLSQDSLVECMFRSARETRQDTLLFYKQWNEFVDLVRYGLLNFPQSEIEELNKQVQRGEIHPAHHSGAYNRANRPAYRVVRREMFKLIMKKELKEVER